MCLRSSIFAIVLIVFLGNCNQENHFFLNYFGAKKISDVLNFDLEEKYKGKSKKEKVKLYTALLKEKLKTSQQMLKDDLSTNPVLHFNHSLIFSLNGKAKEALNSFNHASMLKSVIDSSDYFYNLGNLYYTTNKGEEAVKAYIEALKLNPEHYNAKYNLQLALRKKENQDKEKKKQKEQQKKDKKSQSKDQQDKKNNKGQDKDKQKQKKNGKQQKKTPSKGMTKEQAIRLLNALRGQEKQKLSRSIKRKNGKKGKTAPQNGKDW